MNTQHKQLSTTGSIVLGRLVNGGMFQEFPGDLSLLTSDPRIRLYSPDGAVSTWLEYPAGYEVAIAEKWETLQGPEYRLLYHPMEGWIEPWQRTVEG